VVRKKSRETSEGRSEGFRPAGTLVGGEGEEIRKERGGEATQKEKSLNGCCQESKKNAVTRRKRKDFRPGKKKGFESEESD